MKTTKEYTENKSYVICCWLKIEKLWYNVPKSLKTYDHIFEDSMIVNAWISLTEENLLNVWKKNFRKYRYQ